MRKFKPSWIRPSPTETTIEKLDEKVGNLKLLNDVEKLHSEYCIAIDAPIPKYCMTSLSKNPNMLPEISYSVLEQGGTVREALEKAGFALSYTQIHLADRDLVMQTISGKLFYGNKRQLYSGGIT